MAQPVYCIEARGATVTATCVVATATCVPINQPTGLATISTVEPTHRAASTGLDRAAPRTGPRDPPDKQVWPKSPLSVEFLAACHIQQPPMPNVE